MSGENAELAPAELIRAWVDAWNRGDMDRFTRTFDTGAVVITDPSWMEPGPYEGREAIGRWFRGLRESWGDNVNSITDLQSHGATVLARADWEVQGRSSGIETILDVTCINRVERGMIVFQQWYFDHEKALEAFRRAA